MSNYSKEYKESAIARARATVERLSTLEPTEPELTLDAEPMQRYRDDALVTSLRRERETTRRALHELQAQFEQRLADEISTMKDFLVEVCGTALGTYRNDIVTEMESDYRAVFSSLSKSVDELKAQVARLDGGKEIVELPKLPLRSRLQ